MSDFTRGWRSFWLAIFDGNLQTMLGFLAAVFVFELAGDVFVAVLRATVQAAVGDPT